MWPQVLMRASWSFSIEFLDAERYMCTATQSLAAKLCGGLYSNNSILSSSVSSAIASATSVAAAAVAGKDVMNEASYPACAVSELHF